MGPIERAASLHSATDRLILRSVQRHHGGARAALNPEGPKFGGDRPFVSESSSAPPGQLLSLATGSFRASDLTAVASFGFGAQAVRRVY